MQNNLTTHPILGYKELAAAGAGSSDEALVDVRHYDAAMIARYNKPDMKPYTGEIILVRDSLARKLAAVDVALAASHGLHLKVVYGYRHPEVQRAYFDKRRGELAAQNPDMPEEALNALTHNFVAVPDVAGHPAGAAVDVTVVNDNGGELDMGTGIADYSDPERIKTFAGGLTAEQTRNRQVLHDAMVQEGLAPFYGEWWHFSYGDREWAAFYDKKKALYGAIER